MSHMSRWLGPPLRNTRIHASALGLSPWRVRRSLPASSLGKVRFRAPMVPIWSMLRRVMPTGPLHFTGGRMDPVLADDGFRFSAVGQSTKHSLWVTFKLIYTELSGTQHPIAFSDTFQARRANTL